MSQELTEARMVEGLYSVDIDQKAEKEEIARELFEELNEIITLLVTSLNTDK